MFRDPVDGAFDVSKFLATRTGFLPIAIPITEPAVGFGLGGGVTFFHTPPRLVSTPDGPRMIPPNATVVGGMATVNGSWAAFVGHLHTWDEGRIRYLIGGGYGSLNLDWFGRGDAFAGRAFSYNIEAYALIQKLTFKLGDTDFFVGPMQKLMVTQSEFGGASDLPTPGPDLGIFPLEFDATTSSLGLTLSYDSRNSLFSPTKGTKAGLTVLDSNEVIGSDFDYLRFDAEICQYIPLGGPFTLGLRGSGSYVSDDAPFFDLASISLRGIQRGRYVDNLAISLESELRWDITSRWTLLGFGGVGWAADDLKELDNADARFAGGAGFRYLVARQYDLRLGCDVARGPEDWAFYVTIGTGWLRD